MYQLLLPSNMQLFFEGYAYMLVGGTNLLQVNGPMRNGSLDRHIDPRRRIADMIAEGVVWMLYVEGRGEIPEALDPIQQL